MSEYAKHFDALQRARAANAPEDVLDIIRERMRQANAADIDASRQAIVDKMGPVERAVTAFGENARHSIKQAANLLPGGIGPSDAEVKESAEQLAPLNARSPVAATLGSASIAVPPAVAVGAPGGLLASTAMGAGQGAVFADPGQRGTGAAIGGGLGLGLPLAAGATKRVLTGLVHPQGAGKVLSDMGYADDLTIGQLNPNGWWNTVENAAESLPWVGKKITALRERGSGVLQKALGKEMTPPGGTVPTATDKYEWYKQAKANFPSAYDAVAQQGQVGAIVPGLPQSLAQQIDAIPGMNSAAAERAGGIIGKALEPLQAKGGGWKDLQAARSYLRNAREAYTTSNGADDKLVKKALDAAEASLTGELEAGLPASAKAMLRDTDRAYANTMTARDTLDAQRMALGESVSPARFASEVWSRLPAETVARGEGGSMRQLAQSAYEAFAPRSPSTGQRLLTLGGVGGGAIAAGQPAAALGSLGALRLAYTPAGQRFLKGSYPWQQAIEAMLSGAPAGSSPAATSAAIELAEAMRSPGARFRLIPATAEEER